MLPQRSTLPAALSLARALLVRIAVQAHPVLEQLFVMEGLSASIYYTLHIGVSLIRPRASVLRDRFFRRRQKHCSYDGT